jgi:hypothetical protein
MNYLNDVAANVTARVGFRGNPPHAPRAAGTMGGG